MPNLPPITRANWPWVLLLLALLVTLRAVLTH